MATEESDPTWAQDVNRDLSGRIINVLQEAITEGKYGNANMVTACFCVVEVLDDDGNSKLSVLMSDERIITNLGLANYGLMWLGASMGSSPT